MYRLAIGLIDLMRMFPGRRMSVECMTESVVGVARQCEPTLAAQMHIVVQDPLQPQATASTIVARRS